MTTILSIFIGAATLALAIALIAAFAYNKEDAKDENPLRYHYPPGYFDEK